MERRVIEYCRKQALFEEGMGIVAGVSGGADSVCLLRILADLRREWRLKLYAVHVHHGIRGREAEEDLAFVRQLCEKWEVSLTVRRFDVPELARREGCSVEEAGRKVRYESFARAMRELCCERIAVAHHMDDLAETVLMNLLRGSGLRGMAGIPARRGEIIRPLLCVRREEIEEWLSARRIPWRTDSTNGTDTYLRNRIRHQVLPLLTELNAGAVGHIVQAAGDMREADGYMEREAERIRKESREAKGPGTASASSAGFPTETAQRIYDAVSGCRQLLPLSLVREQSPLMGYYLVRQCLSRQAVGMKDISRLHIEQILALAQNRADGEKGVDLPQGLRVSAEYDRLVLKDPRGQGGRTGFSVEISIFLYDNTKKIPQNSCVNWFDYDKIKDSIQLRCRRTGDRICVAGGGQSRRLKDCMIDLKMPAGVRDCWPLLAAGDRILWIPGYRMAEDCKIGPGTVRVLEAVLQTKE